MNQLITHDILQQLQDSISNELEPVDIPVTHHHVSANGESGGVYAREVFIPKGTVLVGKIHKFEQLNIMSQGDMSVVTAQGVIRVQAPFHIVSPAGTRRAAYAHEDTVWTTIHGTNEKDLDVIESMFVVDTYDKYLEFTQQLIGEQL